MKSNFIKYLALALALLTIIAVGACPKLAAFEVTSLDITPSEATTGETVSITAEVSNIGGSEGTYTAVLSVDGATAETKEVMLAPSASETVTFSLVKDTPGTYQVGIGELTSTLIVQEKLVVKEVELKYDDGTARDSISTISPQWGGHIVDFSPPATPFTIKKVQIAGLLSSYATGLEGKTFDVEILDKDLKVLHSATYPYTKFSFSPATTWVEFEVPDIEVTDKFYAHIYTDSPYPGLHIGADDSVVNEHSACTTRTAEGVITILAGWPYYDGDLWFTDPSKVNWMIRVIGTCLMPES
jgi:hypothetical protein